jgi:uncharacterized membrane protein (UPF0127 family)
VSLLFDILPLISACVDAAPAALAALAIGGGASFVSRHDHDPARMGRLRVDGALRQETRIVRASAWVNGRTGLLNHGGLAAGAGLWLAGCRAIHMRGMLFAIDVVFLDAAGRVLALHSAVPPNAARLRGPRGTAAALELAANGAAALGITLGSSLALD